MTWGVRCTEMIHLKEWWCERFGLSVRFEGTEAEARAEAARLSKMPFDGRCYEAKPFQPAPTEKP